MKILDIIIEATPAPAPKLDPKTIAEAWIKANPDAAQQHIDSLNKTWGNGIMKYFKSANVWGPTIQAGVEVWALEQIASEPLEQFKSTSSTFANYTEQNRKEWIVQARNEIFGVWFDQYAVQIIVRSIFGSTKLLASFLNFVGGGLAVGVSKGKISFASGGRIFEEAAIAGLQIWIASPAGKAWLKETISPAFFNFPGMGVTWLWDKFVDLLKGWTNGKIDLGKITPGIDQARKDVAAADTSGAVQMSPDEYAKKTADFEKATRSSNLTSRTNLN